MWRIIGNISSVCSIVALPIAIWQFRAIKLKIKTTEKGIKNVLDIKEHEQINKISKIIGEEYQKLSTLITQLNQKGKTHQNIVKTCSEINIQINSCIIELPSNYSEIVKGLKKTVEIIDEFVGSDMKNNAALKEARDYLYNSLKEMKQESKEFENRTIGLASHYSE